MCRFAIVKIYERFIVLASITAMERTGRDKIF